MKTKKLNLNDLKVESFVTSMESKDSKTVKGGTGSPCSVMTVSIIIYSIVVITSPPSAPNDCICNTGAYCNTNEGVGKCPKGGTHP